MVISWKGTGKVLDVVYVACNSIIGIQKTLEGSQCTLLLLFYQLYQLGTGGYTQRLSLQLYKALTQSHGSL